MPRTLIGAKVERKAAVILQRAAKKSKQTISAYSAVVLEDHALKILHFEEKRRLDLIKEKNNRKIAKALNEAFK